MKPVVAIGMIALVAACASAQTPTPTSRAPQRSAQECGVSLGKFMNMTFDEFDQTFDKGWREIADKDGCELAAADLIERYRDEKVAQEVAGLDWHEGQLRAAAGETEKAVELFKRYVVFEKSLDAESRSDADILYGEATVAFLERDRRTLEARRARLAVLPMPEGMAQAVADWNTKFSDRPPPSWPLNLDVVDGLIACFDKPYAEAYSFDCRPKPN